ncbi:MAG TPA: hypothetical protein VLJ42_01055 [Solirubrobacteraceae bacterium]|nr:hypothetical protein [Solirubrobacteraceae bacterium]
MTQVSVEELERTDKLLVQDGNHGASRPVGDEILRGTERGIAHVRAADISTDGGINFAAAQQLAESAYQRIRKGRARAGDTLLTHKGTVGLVARVPADTADFLCSPQTTFWRSLDGETVDPGFLFYFLRSPLFQAQLKRRMHETDMAPYVSLTAQRKLWLMLPPVHEQRRIAAVLGALDDKIEHIERVGADQLALLSLEARRLARDHSAGREPLADLALLIRRGISPRYTDEGCLVLNQKCIRDGRISFGPARRHDHAAKPVEGRTLALGDVLVNSTGVGTLGRTAVVRRLPEPTIVDSHVTVVRADADVVVPEYLSYALSCRQAEIEALGEGSTGQTELSRVRLGELLISVPSSARQENFARVARACGALVAAGEQEATRLRALRDELLPKLVSGNIRVSEDFDPDAATAAVA